MTFPRPVFADLKPTRTTAIALVAVCVAATNAAAFGRAASDYSSGTVTAHSRIGNGSLTTRVRPAANGGYEYQTSTGYWRSCEGDCERTITNKVLDFWDNQANRTYPGRGITISPF